LKKLISISFVILFLCTNTEIGQLLKIPVLVHHYVEHNHKEKAITFSAFLNEHYFASKSHPDNSKHDHQNLPFKTCNSHSISTFLAFGELNPFLEQTVNSITTSNAVPFYHQHYTSNLFGAIWQPPKLS
jgi:hypothetical protein